MMYLSWRGGFFRMAPGLRPTFAMTEIRLHRSLEMHLTNLRACTLCPRMHRPPVTGRAVLSRVMLLGQAPGSREPVLGRPFAWTAGRTLFGWFERECGVAEEEFRASVYMAAVCRCFPGRNPVGGDRVPDAGEVENCSRWLHAELALLRPVLILPVGKLAISQFIPFGKLVDVIGRAFPVTHGGHSFDIIPLPHPSGASTWHRAEPGKTLLAQALRLVARHPAWLGRARAEP
jgi:uracil-DNA glycosylase